MTPKRWCMRCKKHIESEPHRVLQKPEFTSYSSTCDGCGDKHDLFVFKGNHDNSTSFYSKGGKQVHWRNR